MPDVIFSVARGVPRALLGAVTCLLTGRLARTKLSGEAVACDTGFLRHGSNQPCTPTLVAKDRRTKLCHAVPFKGAD